MPTKSKKPFDFNIYIIEKYGLEELLNPSLNESFVQELLKGNEQDWAEMKELFNKMRILIPKLIIKIARLGGRTSINLAVAVAKRAYKQGQKHKKVVKTLFFSLVLILAAYSGALIQKYNSNPPIEGTQIEQHGDSIIVHDENESTDTVLTKTEDKIEIKEIAKTEPKQAKEVKQEQTAQSKSSEPIRMLGKGEVAPTTYHFSENMVKALAEVENFSAVLYDAKNPRRKTAITKKDMLNPKCDITIGFGHALTAAERKSWKPNMKITVEQGLKLYKKDLKQKEIELNNALKKLPYYNKCVFSQGFVDGFGSLIFNAGVGSICGNDTRKASEFWNRLSKIRIDTKNHCFNKNDMNFVIAQLKKQNITEKGHIYRRNAEAKIMSMGDNTKEEHYHLLAPEYRKQNGIF